MDDKTKAVKVKAYPIGAKMTIATGVVDAHILKLTPTGFLAEADVPSLKTGEKFQIEFELPMLHDTLSETCVVVKLYTTVGTQMIEGHFHALVHDHERKILKFLSSIPKAAGS